MVLFNTCRQFWDTLVWSMLMTALTSVPALVLLDMSWDRCVRVLLHRMLVLLSDVVILFCIMSCVDWVQHISTLATGACNHTQFLSVINT